MIGTGGGSRERERLGAVTACPGQCLTLPSEAERGKVRGGGGGGGGVVQGGTKEIRKYGKVLSKYKSRERNDPLLFSRQRHCCHCLRRDCFQVSQRGPRGDCRGTEGTEMRVGWSEEWGLGMDSIYAGTVRIC